MKKWLLLLFVVLPYAATAQITPEFDAYITTRMKAERMPSVVIALIDEQGAVSYHNYGFADLDKTKPASEHTIYEIGSVTKTFAASLVKIYADKQKKSGDTPMQVLLPEASFPKHEGMEILLKHMVSHFSGLPRLPENMDLTVLDDPYKTYSTKELFNSLSTHELRRAPGTQFEYSNMAYMILGRTAEKMAKREFDELIALQFTKPLKMQSTSRILKDSSRFATPTNMGNEVSEWNFNELRGVGELRSTTHDMALYLKAFLGHTKHKEQKSLNSTWQSPLAEVRPGLTMGYAWFIREKEGVTTISHGGGTGGFRTFIGFNPEKKTGVVVFTNSNEEIEDIGLHLINPAFELKKITVVELSTTQRARLIGQYRIPNGPFFKIYEDNGLLFGQMSGQQALPLKAKSDSVLFNTMVQAELIFDLSEVRSPKFALKQGGNKLFFERTNEAPKQKQEIQLPDEAISRYSGKFKNEQTGLVLTLIPESGRLLAQLSGQGSVQVYPSSESVFFYKIVEAELHMEFDENKQLVKVVLHQAGQQLPFLKLN